MCRYRPHWGRSLGANFLPASPSAKVHWHELWTCHIDWRQYASELDQFIRPCNVITPPLATVHIQNRPQFIPLIFEHERCLWLWVPSVPIYILKMNVLSWLLICWTGDKLVSTSLSYIHQMFYGLLKNCHFLLTWSHYLFKVHHLHLKKWLHIAMQITWLARL